jgi:uncharacterized UBP type Zn finger protein
VDWTDLKYYNHKFSSFIEIDALSNAAEKQKNTDKVNLNECFELILQPEKVEMQCDKCQHPEQLRTEIL